MGARQSLGWDCLTPAALALAAAVLLAACSGSHRTGLADNGADAGGDDGGLTDATADRQLDAGLWPTTAALFTREALMLPECVATMHCINGPCFAPREVSSLLLARRGAGGVELRGGSGMPLNDPPGSYSFTESFRPSSVPATTQPAETGDSGIPYTRFVTASDFAFDYFFPNTKMLHLHRGRLEGTFDEHGVPRSVEPPFSGRLSGCASQEALQQLYIDELQQTLWQVLMSSGCQLDCATNGEKPIDGCRFEFRWQADEVVPVQVGEPDGG